MSSPDTPAGDYRSSANDAPHFEAMYEELRAIARGYLAGERVGHSLQATALVHEAYLRLNLRTPSDSAAFLRSAARAMRQVLVDHARGKAMLKRGGRLARQPLDAVELATTGHLYELLAIDEALSRLAMADESAAECVRLRFYGGLSIEEVARVMGISARNAYREWAYARAFLFRLLGEEEEAENRPEDGSPRDRLSPPV